MFDQGDSTASHSRGNDPLTVRQPTKGAERNQRFADNAGRGSEDILLPSLEEGLTLLDVDGGRGVTVLQSLVLDHLLMSDGPAFWIDAHGYATTSSLARIAPSQRLLDRVHVARGFTSYQHYGAVCDLPTAVNQSIQMPTTTPTRPLERENHEPKSESDRYTPGLIVAPVVDALYRSDDTLDERQARMLQARVLARLREYADSYDVPVLLTRTTDDEFTAPLATAADHYLACEQTRFGPRFVGDEFETLVYPVDAGAYYQTTFAYWQQLLAARATRVGLEPATASTSSTGADVGKGVTGDGETASLTADPLLDAWTETGARGR